MIHYRVAMTAGRIHSAGFVVAVPSQLRHHQDAGDRVLLLSAVPWRKPITIDNGRDPTGEHRGAWRYMEWFRPGSVDLRQRPPIHLEHAAYDGPYIGETLVLLDEPWGLDAIVELNESRHSDRVLDLLDRNHRLPVSIGFKQLRGGFVVHDGFKPGVERTAVELTEIAILDLTQGAYPDAHVVGRMARPSNLELATRSVARLDRHELRHLPGQHDQKSHGNWAKAKKAANLAEKLGESVAEAAKRKPAKPAKAAKAAPKKASPPKAASRKPRRPTRAEIKAAEDHARSLGMAKTVAWANRDQVARELTRQAGLTPRSMRELDAVNLPRRNSSDADAYLASKNGRALAYYTPLGSHPSVYATAQANADNPRPAIWMSPEWLGDHGFGPMSGAKVRGQRTGHYAPADTATPMEATLAHEYGHHVTKVFFGEIDSDGTAEMPVDIGLRFLPTLNDALGANRFTSSAYVTNRPDRDLLAPTQHGFIGDLKTRFSGAILDTWVMENKDVITEKVSRYATTNLSELLAEIWTEYSTKGAAARPHIKVIGDLIKQIAEEMRA